MFILAFVVPALVVLIVLVIIPIAVFYVYPKFKNSRTVDNITQGLSSDGNLNKNSTGEIIKDIKDGLGELGKKQKENVQQIKSKIKDNETIDGVLRSKK